MRFHGQALILCALTAASHAFMPIPTTRQPSLSSVAATSRDDTKPFFAEKTAPKPKTETMASSASESAPTSAPALQVDGSEDPYKTLGIKEDELAIGVDPAEVLKWIGTKEALVAKFQRDNKGMDEERASNEVGKFYMDAEMVNAYIKFEKDKVTNPPNYRAEAEQTLSDPKTVATYAAWLIGGASFGFIRTNIIEPKYASGEWEEFHIQLPFFEQQKAAIEGAAAAAADAASAASDPVVSAAADAVSGSL